MGATLTAAARRVVRAGSVSIVITRTGLRCPGCEEKFIARLDLNPTRGTRFYLPCPICRTPITGSQSGEELPTHSVHMDAEVLPEHPEGAPVVTVNPFVPARYTADSFDGLGAMPTMTLLHLLGQDAFGELMGDEGRAQRVIEETWPPARRLFDYYLQERWSVFDKTSTALGRPPGDGTLEDRAGRAYSALVEVTANVVGDSGNRGEVLFERFGRKHLAAIKRDPYVDLLRQRDARARVMERDMFGALRRFLEISESWAMGRLPRYVPAANTQELEDLTLFRDEFALVRDVYQQGFEQACKGLWILVAAQNTVKRGDPDSFADHPSALTPKQRVSTLTQFDNLPNAFKIAYAAQVPGWEVVADFLNSKRRNAIGHGSARHDLNTGRVLSDKDPSGVGYLAFLAEVFDVFEVLSALTQTVRAVRVVASQAPTATI